MDTITKERNRQIRAVIAPEAIGKVTRFFDASTRQILRELLQNARRAGATLVEIEDDQRTITITDNGTGIADPQTLLSFGASSWSEETKASEDPAGMGFFSLAKRNASIESRPKNGAPPDGRRISRSWRVDLTTDNFIGTQPAVVREGHNAPRPHGTKVRFNASGRNERSEQFLVQDASEYYPVPVRLNGKTLPRTDFLKTAVHTETWKGLRLGVLTSKSAALEKNKINFHGLVVRNVDLPTVTSITVGRHGLPVNWWVDVDVIDCPDLELLLPARQGVIENRFLKELQTESRRAIYRAMLECSTETDISFEDWAHARELGVQMPEPKPMLQPWSARHADTWDDPHDSFCYHSPVNAAGEGEQRSLLMIADMDHGDEVTLERAFKKTGFKRPVLRKKAALYGYSWYDSLDRLTWVEVLMKQDGKTTTRDKACDHEAEAQALRCEEVVLRLTIETTHGVETIDLKTDLAFGYAEATCPEEILIVLAHGSDIGSVALADAMEAAYFHPVEDAEADSAATQRMQFERECRSIATEVTSSKEQAQKETITTLVHEYIGHAVRAGQTVTIHRGHGTAPPLEVEIETSEEPGNNHEDHVQNA